MERITERQALHKVLRVRKMPRQTLYNPNCASSHCISELWRLGGYGKAGGPSTSAEGVRAMLFNSFGVHELHIGSSMSLGVLREPAELSVTIQVGGQLQVVSTGEHDLPPEGVEQLVLECHFREEWRVGKRHTVVGMHPLNPASSTLNPLVPPPVLNVGVG
eukprot:1575089-Pyramimonas_sp.AAC.1